MMDVVKNIKFEVEWLRATDRDQGIVSEHFKLIAKRFAGYGPDCWCEYLYRTNKGNYFIYGIGREQSKYGRPNEFGWWEPGDAIIPLPPQEILDWCQDCLDDVKDMT